MHNSPTLDQDPGASGTAAAVSLIRKEELMILKSKLKVQKTKIDLLNAEKSTMTAQLENLAAIAFINANIVYREEVDSSESVDGGTIKSQIAANDKITVALESENERIIEE